MKTQSSKFLGHRKMLKTQHLHFKPFTTIISFSALLLLFLNPPVKICDGSSLMASNHAKVGNFDAMVKRGCASKTSECSAMAMEEEDEMEMEMSSESNRRVLLMHKRYISYDTLRRDLVPCDTPGASYYNCKGPGKAGTYHRGCEIITRCARQINGINY